MDLLLDTHALIWYRRGSERLSETAGKMIADSENRMLIAQAMAGGMTLVTVDAMFRLYAVPIAW
jgi:PIN domain nuclease of toxin-antitoxin system